MKYIYLLSCLIVTLLFVSCGKEDTLVPSEYDTNWLSIKDNPLDPTDHAIYEIYKKTGVPIFYNDTIGYQTRVDNFGNSYKFYEVLAVDYSFASTSTTVDYYQIVQNKEDVLPAVNFINNEILPIIPKGVYIPSILLLDSLQSVTSGIYAHRGLNTVAIGAVPHIPYMEASTIKKYKGAILRAMIGGFILNDKNAAWLNTNFYSVSRALYNTKDIYASVYLYDLQRVNLPSFEAAGFLTKNTSVEDWGWPMTPPVWLDVYSYIEASFAYSPSEFVALYGNYPVIMLKYERMQTLLKKLGFVL